jgi:hypothetical protein
MTTKPDTLVPANAIVLFSKSEVETYELVAQDLEKSRRSLEAIGAITSTEVEANVNDGLVECKRLIVTAEELRKKQVGPLNDQVKTINNAWRPLTEALSALATKAGNKIVVWKQGERERIAREQAEVRRRQEEAARKQQEALERADKARNSKTREAALEAAATAGQQLSEARLAEPMAAPTGIRTSEGSSFMRKHMAFKVVDPTKVPREFLCVDEKAIRAAVAKGVVDIAGVSIYEEESLATRVG